MDNKEEKLIGISEAYSMYCLLPEDAQAKIPEEFVEKLKKYANPDLGYPIETVYSLKSNKLSNEGVKLMAYMCSFLKEKDNLK